MEKMPRQYSFVKFIPDDLKTFMKFPFKADRTYVFFGELPTMPGHCIVSDYVTGKIYSGWHMHNFTEIKED
jgi:hypothetical protein